MLVDTVFFILSKLDITVDAVEVTLETIPPKLDVNDEIQPLISNNELRYSPRLRPPVPPNKLSNNTERSSVGMDMPNVPNGSAIKLLTQFSTSKPRIADTSSIKDGWSDDSPSDAETGSGKIASHIIPRISRSFNGSNHESIPFANDSENHLPKLATGSLLSNQLLGSNNQLKKSLNILPKASHP